MSPATVKTRGAADALAAITEALESRGQAWDQFPIDGMSQTLGYTRGGWRRQYKNREPRVWVFARTVKHPTIPGRSLPADPLVRALWDTLPEGERKRARLFCHCAACPLRFTKNGAIADAFRHGRSYRYAPPTRWERASAEARALIEPPRLVMDQGYDAFEEAVALVWDDLGHTTRRTLYAWLRPGDEMREWSREGAPSPEAFSSRVKTARREVARALAERVFPARSYMVATGGRPRFDEARVWEDWDSSDFGVG